MRQQDRLPALIKAPMPGTLILTYDLAEELSPVVDTAQPRPELKPLYDRRYRIFDRAY